MDMVAEAILERVGQDRGFDRIAAQSKEVLLDADPFEFQNLLPHRAHQLLSSAAGGAEDLARRLPRRVWPRECPAVELAVRRQRKLFEQDQMGGKHVFWHFTLQVLAQAGGGRAAAGVADYVSNQTPLAAAVVGSHDRDRGNFRMPPQRGFDLTELDAKPTNLDLIIAPPEKLDRAIAAETDEITCAVQPLTGSSRERVGDEALGGLVRLSQIATSKRHAAERELPDQSYRHRMEKLGRSYTPRRYGSAGRSKVFPREADRSRPWQRSSLLSGRNN